MLESELKGNGTKRDMRESEMKGDQKIMNCKSLDLREIIPKVT